MIRKYFLPLLAVAGIVFAIRSSFQSRANLHGGDPALPGPAPTTAAYADRVSGAGMVEASSENLSIGVPAPGLVAQVMVKTGEAVKAGAPLLRLDDRAALASVEAAAAQLALARAQVKELESWPRPEELRRAEARRDQAKAAAANAQAQAKRAEELFTKGVSPEEERIARTSARDEALAMLAGAEAEVEQIRTGTWAPTLDTARARAAVAEAEWKQATTEVDRLTIRAPMDGTVLQLDVKVGEYAQPGPQALLVLGNIDTLHVRVDVDEQDAHRVRPGAPAVASPRGDPGRTIPLSYIGLEPLVVPKRNLTGDNLERVDTRVLQVIYQVSPGSGLRVGQQVDVQIEAPSRRL